MSDIRLFASTVESDIESALIRWEGKSAWSHCGFYRKSDQWTFSALLDGGVKWRPPNPAAKVLVLTAQGQDAALSRALTKEGEAYDWLDILGIATGRNWAMEGRMICDKLVFWSFQDIGAPLLNHTFIPLMHLAPDDILKSPYVLEDKE